MESTNEQHENNATAMREALETTKKAICNHARANHTCASLAWESSTINANCADILCGHRGLCEAKTAIQKALSKPPRNCDVGTAEEQCDRHRLWCSSHSVSGDMDADCANTDCSACAIMWAQMPYEEKKNGSEQQTKTKETAWKH